jgi:hypothetical protein
MILFFTVSKIFYLRRNLLGLICDKRNLEGVKVEVTGTPRIFLWKP